MSQFVMHRGVIMTATQALYSVLYNCVPTALYNDWLMMAFATFFTNLPVISLIFDWFVPVDTVLAFPELYRYGQKGRHLSGKTFLKWVWLAIYQGCVITGLSILLFGMTNVERRNFESVAYSSLVCTELLLVIFEINHMNWVSVVAEIGSVALYLGSILALGDAFDLTFVFSWGFAWRLCVVTMVCIVPFAVYEALDRVYMPRIEERLTRSVGSGLGESQFVIL
jgi:phospholipid-translocating ATPase